MAELYCLPEKGILVVHDGYDLLFISTKVVENEVSYDVMSKSERFVEKFNEWLETNGINLQEQEPKEVKYVVLAFKEYSTL